TLRFQWQKNGVNLADGAKFWESSTSTLMVSNVTAGDAGIYSVIISNSFGAVTSRPVILAVYSAGPNNLVGNGGFETGDFTGWFEFGDGTSNAVTAAPL